MPDTRQHRGPHPNDRKIFRSAVIPQLQTAVAEYSWLLTHDYPPKAALKLVGDKFQFKKRQLSAIRRSACSDQSLRYRQSHKVPINKLSGASIGIDAYNLLITIESALSHGFLFIGRDQCYRDLSSVHGTYRRVEETFPALQLIGETLETLKVSEVKWLIDKPVSNSGRLKGFIYDAAEEKNWPWEAELVYSPDKRLIDNAMITISTDSHILDESARWSNVGAYLIQHQIDDPGPIINLGEKTSAPGRRGS